MWARSSCTARWKERKAAPCTSVQTIPSPTRFLPTSSCRYGGKTAESIRNGGKNVPEKPAGGQSARLPALSSEGCMTSQQADNIVFASDLPLSSRLISLGEVIHFKKKQIIFEMGTVRKTYYILSGSVVLLNSPEESNGWFRLPSFRATLSVMSAFLPNFPFHFRWKPSPISP